jgi:hypothetical protein
MTWYRRNDASSPPQDRESLPCGPPPGWKPNAQRPELPTHVPGDGLALLRELWGPDRIPDMTPEGERRVDELIDRARRDVAAQDRAAQDRNAA